MKRRGFLKMFGALAALPVVGKAAADAVPVPVQVDHANKTITGVELYSHLMKEWDDPAQRIPDFAPPVLVPKSSDANETLARTLEGLEAAGIIATDEK